MNESIHVIPPTSRGVSGVGIAVLQLSRPVWHQWWRRGVLRVWQGVAQHHWLPYLGTLNTGFLLPLAGHEALQVLEGKKRSIPECQSASQHQKDTLHIAD